MMTLDQIFIEAVRQVQLAFLFFVAYVATAIMAAWTVISIVIVSLRGRSNCMIEAYKAWQRGHYVIMRKTRHGRGWRWPHFGWSEDGGRSWKEFVPSEGRFLRWIPPLMFKGHVQSMELHS